MSNSLTNFAEQWIDHYKTTTTPVSYQSFDFESIKRSLVDYLKVYHPEYFNNLIETDELLPLIEMFAYVGELYSYRVDMNTQEHILANATRKSSAIQLANMLGYTTSRRVAATGLVKLTALSTTENILDINGNSIRGKLIKWNDSMNANWQSQFTKILNKILNNQSGVVSDRDKTSIGGVLVERYSLNTSDLTNGVVQYTASVNGSTLTMELVSAELQDSSITEEPPTGSRPLSVLFLNDGLGNGSGNTGYFFVTKQGSLTKETFVFGGNAPNVVQELSTTGINDSDVFLNRVDNAGAVLEHWTQVPNVSYNDQLVRTVYQVESLENDGIRLVFGDGSYSNVPTGTFDCWVRTSDAIEYSIPIASIQNQRTTFQYFDAAGNSQTLTVEFALTSPLSNASESETIDKIKSSAPGVFYTQDRMVNAQDYQQFLLQEPSIIKTKAVNRTFAGHSKYKGWYDGSEVYDNVKIFGNDGVLYFDNDVKLLSVANPNSSVTIPMLIDQHIEPMLERPDMWLFIAQRLGAETNPSVRKYFTVAEKQQLNSRISLLVYGSWVALSWDESSVSWVISTNGITDGGNDIEIRLDSLTTGWALSTSVSRTILHSPTTKFWDYTISASQDYDTLLPTKDLITVLQANTNALRTGILAADVPYSVVNLYVPYTALPNQSTIDYSRIEIVGKDANGDIFPEDLYSSQLLDSTSEVFFYKNPNNPSSEYVFVPDTSEVRARYAAGESGYVKKVGRSGLNFLWQHFTDQFELVDPARTNINDVYVVTKSYYANMMKWLQSTDTTSSEPTSPSYSELRTMYSAYLNKKMMSDEVVLRPARFKILFGSKARSELRAKFQLVVQGQLVSNITIKQDVVRLVREYFDISNVDFGDTFFFSDLSRYVTTNSKHAIGSMLLVPLFPAFQFGDLYQIKAAADEILIADVQITDIEIVENITNLNLRQ